MKDLKNLKGAKLISKHDQRLVKGGVLYYCDIYGHDCPPNYYCDWQDSERGVCRPELLPK